MIKLFSLNKVALSYDQYLVFDYKAIWFENQKQWFLHSYFNYLCFGWNLVFIVIRFACRIYIIS